MRRDPVPDPGSHQHQSDPPGAPESQVATDPPPGDRSHSLLFSAAALVVLVVGLRAAQPILVPLLLAGFIAILCLPLLTLLIRRRVPPPFAVGLVLLAAVVALALVAGVVGSSVSAFSSRLPFYQARFHSLFADLQVWLSGLGITVSLDRVTGAVDPAAVMRVFSNGLMALAGVLSNGLLVLLVVVFILGEAVGLPTKVRAALRTRPGLSPEASRAALDRLALLVKQVQRYLAWKSLISLGTGVAVGLWCWLLGVDFPFLWGLVAFLLNFVPNIGSLLAAAPPVLLATVGLGPGRALAVAAGYVAANLVFGNVLEPLVMGRKLGLSSLVVFLSLILWGFVWGPVGMLLSVPLTVMVRIGLEASPSTRWIAVLLGPAPANEEGGAAAAIAAPGQDAPT